MFSSGLGSQVVQQLALLGVGSLVLVDAEELDETNGNRYVGATHDDPIPGSPNGMSEAFVNTMRDLGAADLPAVRRLSASRPDLYRVSLRVSPSILIASAPRSARPLSV